MQKLIRDMEGLNQGGKGEVKARGQLSSAETGREIDYMWRGKGKS